MKTQGFFLVKPGNATKLTDDAGFYFLMECIFYKNPRLIGVAMAIFDEMVRHSYYDATRWRDFIRKHRVGQSGYYAVMTRLVRLGLIMRKRRRYYLSRDFSDFLEKSAQLWNEKVRHWRVRSLFQTF
jgi:hypothetical protein